MRVGLHAGEAVKEGDDYFGTPVVIAKRLCDLAAPGQILASHLVRALVGNRGSFQFRDTGTMSLKSIALPLPSKEIVWGASAVASATSEDTATSRAAGQPVAAPPAMPVPVAVAPPRPPRRNQAPPPARREAYRSLRSPPRASFWSLAESLSACWSLAVGVEVEAAQAQSRRDNQE